MVKPLLRRLGLVLVLVAAVRVLLTAQPPTDDRPPIRLRGATFTPTRGQRPSIPSGLAAQRQPSDRAGYFLVQFQGPILETWKQALTATGAEIVEYVPDFAFKVRMTGAQANRVSQLPPVVWIDDFQPAYKLSGLTASSRQRAYVVHVERGADETAVAAAVAATGAQITARSGLKITVVADSAGLASIARIAEVASVEDFQLRQKHSEYAGGVIMGADAAHAAGFDGSSQTIAVADTGLGGGTTLSAHADLQPPRLTALFNWPGAAGGCFTSVINDGAVDVSTGHGTHTTLSAAGAGGSAGEGRGTAPAARVAFQAIENWAVPSSFCSLLYNIGPGYFLVGLPADLRALFQQAYDTGARIHSDSWGADVSGAYNADSAEADDFIWNHRNMAITFSAGNAGTDANADGLVDTGSLAAPASAKNIIAVGASENDRQSRYDCDPSLSYTDCAAQGGLNSLFTYATTWPGRFPALPLSADVSAGNAEQMAAFSSRGPAQDGRIKPDVVAPGTWILSGYSDAFQQQYDHAPNPQDGLYQYDGWGFPLNERYKYLGGTSMATPLVAGAAALVRDYYVKARQHEASAALVKATLVNSATDLADENNDGVNDNAYPIPNPHEGWGRVNVASAVDPRRQFADEGPVLTTNTSWATPFPIRSGRPFKVTLAWSDYPSSATAARNLVNDLDLRVTSPSGEVYLGNAFAGGWSETGGTADRLNNLENVFVANPAAGDWVVEVVGFNVPFGPQPFALVLDGEFEGAASSLPAVTVVATGSTANEAGAAPGTFRVTRTGATTAPLTVRYSLGGTAKAGSDYVTLGGTVTISDGSLAADILIAPIDDVEVEANESVTLTLVADAAYSVAVPASATVTIVSDDIYPDLVVSALAAPSRAAAGEVFAVTDTTRNQGGGQAMSSTTRFYLSPNLLLDASDIVLGSRVVPALGASASDTATTSLTLPNGAGAGTYYVLAQADGNLAVSESLETNNVRFSGAIQVGGDLTVSALTVPAVAGAGGAIVVTDSTTNVGDTLVSSSVTTFYLSTNVIIDSADTALGSREIGPLAAGATNAASTTLMLPATVVTGTYYILAQADATNLVVESSESNNVRFSAAVKVGPDLAVSALTVPMAAGAGATIVVSDTTQNAGGGAAGSSSTVFYLSTNATLDSGDVLLGSRGVPALAPNGTASASTPLAIPPATATGPYYVLALADGLLAVSEANESNNIRLSSPVQVGPDLVVSALTASAAAGAGGHVTVTDITRNQGAGAAPGSTTTFYLSVNLTIDQTDAFLGSRAVGALTAGASETASTVFLVSAEVPAGTYYVLAQADGAAAVPETLETNNTRFSSTVRIGPDLLVTTLTVPTAQVPAGATISVSATIANQGAGAAGPSATRFYLSSNALLDSADVEIGARGAAAIAAGGSDSGSTTLRVPASTPTGTYFILAKADGDEGVAETSETNNVRAGWIRVGP